MSHLIKILLLLCLSFGANYAFSCDCISNDEYDLYTEQNPEITYGKIRAVQVHVMDTELDELETQLNKRANQLAMIIDDITEGKILAVEIGIIEGMIEKLRNDLNLIDLHDDFSYFQNQFDEIKKLIHNL